MKILSKIEDLSNTSIALGHFDGLHLGHRAVVDSILGSGTQSVVLSIGKVTERIISPEERNRLIEDWGADVLCLAPFEDLRDLSGEEFVFDILKEKLGAVSVSCGYNYRFGKGASCGTAQLQELCASCGISCKVIEKVSLSEQTVSSSAIRSALRSGDVELAGSMLGRRYGYSFPVAHGNGIGKQFGTPTVNQQFPEGMLIPRYGVYASNCFVGGKRYKSVTNIGVKPTIGEGFAPCSETFILDFSGDLYEESVRVELLGFLRPEQRFESLEALKKQIHEDAKRAAEY